MKGLLWQDSNLIAVLKSLVQYSKTLQLSYDTSFNEAHISNKWKDLVSGGFLQNAVEAMYQSYISVTQLMGRGSAARRK